MGALAGLATALSLFATRTGPRATQDSANYLAMAKRLFGDGAMVGVGGRPVAVFPPGYPGLLALGDAAMGQALWLRLLPAMCAAATVVCVGVLVRRHVEDRRWSVVAAAGAALSPALSLVWMTTWSEGPFVAALGVFVVAADALWSDHAPTSGGGRGRAWLGVAVLAIWAATSFRYLGVVLVPVLGTVVALRHRPVRWRGAGLGLAAAAVAIVVPGAIVARNLAVDGSPLGARTPSVASPADLLSTAASTVLQWVVPGSALLALVVLTAAGCWLVLSGRSGIVRSTLVDLGPTGWTAGLMFAFLLVSGLTTSLDGMDDRLMSALVVPLLVILAVVADGVAQEGPQFARAVLTCAAAWLVLAAAATVAQAIDPPVSLAPSRFAGSELMASTRQLPSGATVVSNRPEAVWMATGRRPVGPMPTTSPRGWEPADPVSSGLRHTVGCAGGSVLAVWFDDVRAPWIAPEDLPTEFDVDVVELRDDGRVLRISASGPLPDDCPAA